MERERKREREKERERERERGRGGEREREREREREKIICVPADHLLVRNEIFEQTHRLIINVHPSYFSCRTALRLSRVSTVVRVKFR